MIQKGFVKDGGQFWYYEMYKAEQINNLPTIVLLHEGLGSTAQWKNWPKLLQEKLQMNILVYDRTGYGKSAPVPENYPFDYLRFEAKYVLPKILNQLAINTAHLFGHSDGSTISLLAAAYHPEKINSVISEAAHVIIEEVSVKGIRETRKIYNQKLKRPLRKYHSDKTDWVFYHWADTWIKPQFKDWNMIEELQKIQCPVLAIQGRQDQYGSYEQLKVIQENCQSKLLYLENCGHHPHFEHAETILMESESFLYSAK